MLRPTTALIGAALLATACGSAVAPASPEPTGAAAAAATSAPASSTATPIDTSPPSPALTAEAIYSGRVPDLSGYDPHRLRMVVATGGIVPARLTMHGIRQIGDFGYPWQQVTSILRSGDVTLMNVEVPLLPNCPDITTGFTFCGDARMVGPMVAAGTNVVANIDNNHIGNFGVSGIATTASELESAGALVTGFQRVAVRTVRNVRFAFVGINFVTGHTVDPDLVRKEIAAARAQGDIVIAHLHWGKEYETYPLPAPGIAPTDPKVMGHIAIDAGADLVIGNHPHCAQGSEWYHGHLITYAHGNFLFDQDWSVGTQESVIGRYWFYDNRLVAAQMIHVRIANRVQPRPLDPTSGEGRSLLDRLLRSSREIAGLLPPHRPDLSIATNACT